MIEIHEDLSTVLTPFQEGALPAAGWESLKNLLMDLPFAAWVEQDDAGVVFANRSESLSYRLGSRAQREIRNALSGELGGEPIRIRDLRGQWIEVCATCHPLPLSVGVEGTLPAMSLYLVCLPGQEPQRDRAVIEALLRCLLGGGVPDALASLTPQQRNIYRLLMSQHSYKEIAGQLGLAHATVRVQIAAMRKRLGPKVIPLLRQS